MDPAILLCSPQIKTGSVATNSLMHERHWSSLFGELWSMTERDLPGITELVAVIDRAYSSGIRSHIMKLASFYVLCSFLFLGPMVQQPPPKRTFEVANVKPIDPTNSVFVAM